MAVKYNLETEVGQQYVFMKNWRREGLNAELLLSEIGSISKKYDLLYQKTGGYFNIFEITDIATVETVVCRVLYELLSPKGSHHQGNIYLKLFVEHVLKKHVLKMEEISDEELRNASVYREFSIDQLRRIDLVIETEKHFIPIEVKIYAIEQKNQCQDYYQYAKDRIPQKESKLFYLTRFGEPPSEYSRGNLKEDDVTNISFEKDILGWLSHCLKETIKLAPIREVLQQFVAAIRRFTNQMEDDKTMEMKELLMKSSENMRSADAIEKSLRDSKIDMLEKLLRAIEGSISQKKLPNEYDYEHNDKNCIKNYYSSRRQYPAINYLYKENVKPGADKIDIWLRIEIDGEYGGIYIGLYVVENGKPGKQSKHLLTS
ncbi:MAG: PD-(D/E)XK nuclease family protein, partial [Prolixibacteraceae bacterium]|nr:PD-(D/E)XK nuclease family protein [Prolixibacteraceae bacterium]